jgi:hypothetical protein
VSFVVSVLSALAAVLPLPDAAAAPRLRAFRTAAPPVIDGRLDDPAWQQAPASRAFTQKAPFEGAPPSEATEVRVLYDDAALYVAIDCEQLASPVTARLTRRDREIEADQVTVAISSRGDQRTAFEFAVTASGVLSDGLYFDDEEYARSWDENWEAEVTRTPRGWSAELHIPLRALRFEGRPVESWGFNVWRFISARQEIAEWAYAPRTLSGVVSRFGTLDNLVGLPRRRHLELRPFVLGEVTHLGAGFGPQVGTDPRVSAGLDARAHPTGDLTLVAALNPDFGQVEADEVILNLGTLETSYPEKRPFFLEGTDLWSGRVLYTRRIGSVPSSPALRPGEELVEREAPTPILGALKLVGRPTPALVMGLLSAVTAANNLRVRLAPDAAPPGEPPEQARVAVPLTLFNALRLRWDLPQGSHLGLHASAVNRQERPQRYPRLPAGSGTPPLAEERQLCSGGARVTPGDRCFRDAYVAGIDGRWRSPARTYSVSGLALLSLLQGGPPRPQRDGTVLASGDVGPIASLTAAKDGGEHWLADAGAQLTGRHADSNDLGFQERQNELRLFANVSYRTTRPWGPTLETQTGIENFQQTDVGGLVLTRLVQLYSEWQLRNFWEVQARLILSPAAFDDREIGDGGAIQRPGRGGGELEVSSDPRRRVVAELELRGEWLRGGGRYSAELGLELKLMPQLEIELEPSATFRRGEPRFIDRDAGAAGETRYLFGELTAASVGSVVRLTWTFTPRLTLQGYGQLFLLSRRYRHFTEARATAPRPRFHLRDLAATAPPPEGDNPDDREGVLNANVLLRWEYRLGSTLYLVYTRSQRPASEVVAPGSNGLGLEDVYRGPAANTFLLKLAYWWG